MNTAIEMPKYVSHKTVHALKIESVNGHELTFTDKRYAPVTPAAEVFARYTPVPGDYFVVYTDGYQSFSPAKAFEEGYTLVA